MAQHQSNLAILCRRFGEPIHVLQSEIRPIAPLAAGQIRVEMSLAPINPSDLIPVQGRYSHRISLPFVAGYEGVGTVVAISSGVSPTLIGRRVLPLRGEGTWQQTVCSPAEFAVALPDWMDDDCSAQLYINPLTAWVVCRHQFAIQPNQTLVVNAANSVLGRLLAQLSSVLGFRMIAVVRNLAHRHLLLNAGAEAVIEDTEEVVETIKQLTGGVGADYAIDLVGGNSGTRLAFALRPQGRFMVLGLLSGRQADWQDIYQRLQIHCEMFHLRLWYGSSTSSLWQSEFQRIITLFKQEKLMLPPANRCFPLAEFKRAIEYATSEVKLNKTFLQFRP